MKERNLRIDLKLISIFVLADFHDQVQLVQKVCYAYITALRRNRLISLSINNKLFVTKEHFFFLFLFLFLLIILHFLFIDSIEERENRHHCAFFLLSVFLSALFFVFPLRSMNIFTQIATQFLINKTTLIQLLKTLHFPDEFLEEFRNDRISIVEDLIRRKVRVLCGINDDESFQDLFCHEDGIQFVFHIHFHDSRFIRFRVSFDIKIIALILNNHHQTIQFMINNIQIKSLNRLSKPFRFCIRVSQKNFLQTSIMSRATENIFFI
jgi:hypothetical protein